MRLIFLLSAAAFTLSTNCVNAQNMVRWMTMEEAITKSENAPRKIFVNVYTEWCKWCKKMDNTTLADDKIAKYINENFYPVRFDAEYKETIVFNNVEFNYVKSYPKGYNELAVELLGGKLSFPSLVFIDEKMRVIQSMDGVIEVQELNMILQYFATDNYKTIPWRKYSKQYSLPVKKD